MTGLCRDKVIDKNRDKDKGRYKDNEVDHNKERDKGEGEKHELVFRQGKGQR